MMKIMNKLVMTLAGLLLIAAAVLKFQEMLSICIPSWQVNKLGFWESYEFFLIQIPLESALGVWLVSGLFRKAAWGVGTLAYLGFIGVTLTKAVMGAESCGCFGQIHVNPWITLFVIDVPFFLLLAVCRPKGYKLLPPPWPNAFYLLAIAVPTIGLMVLAAPVLVAMRPDCIKVENTPDPSAALKLEIFKLKQDLSKNQQIIDELQKTITELQKVPRTTDKKAFIGALEVVAADKPNAYEITIGGKQTLLLNADNLDDILLSVRDAQKQAITVTEAGQAEVTWTEPEPAEVNTPPAQISDANEQAPAAAKWDWLQYVVEDDVRAQLAEGMVVVLMYHHDCPVCAEMVPKYSDYCKQMTEQGNEAFKIAFLAVPPYGDGPVPEDTTCISGTLTDQKNWGLMSPYVVALLDGEPVKTWEQGTAPEPEKILEEIFGQ